MKPLKVFVSYSHRDRTFSKDLIAHLCSLERSGVIEAWHDGLISPGSEWEQDIARQLQQADIILFLLSAHFFQSEFCYEKELAVALKKHDSGQATVVPILIRPVAWEHTPLGKLQALPKGLKAIELWKNRNEAWTQVTQALLGLASDLRTRLGRVNPASKGTIQPVHEALGYIVGLISSLDPSNQTKYFRLLAESDGSEQELGSKLVDSLRPLDHVLAERVRVFHQLYEAERANGAAASAAFEDLDLKKVGEHLLPALFGARLAIRQEFSVHRAMAGVQALEVIEGSNPIVAATFKAYNEYLPPTQEIARQRLKKAVDEFSTNASWVAGVLTSLKELVAAIKEAFKE